MAAGAFVLILLSIVTPSQAALVAAFPKPSAPIVGPQPQRSSIGAVTAPSPPIVTTSGDVAAVVSSENQFAFNLFGALSGTNTGNLVFSPYSISTALAMTYAGAQGQTASEMAQTLQYTIPQSRVAPAVGQLIDETLAPSGAAYQLDVADRFWGQTGKTFLPAFLNTMSTDYQSPLVQLDFADAPESSRNTINTWTANQTNQRIRNLMPEGSITPYTSLVLTNAIYFNGKWTNPFTTSKTSPQNFQLGSGSVESVPMMHQESDFDFGKFQNFSMLELPYQGSSLSMVVILPSASNGLAAVEKSLNPQTLQQDENKLAATEVKVGLPKFTSTTRVRL